jgi:hypothetical protein
MLERWLPLFAWSLGIAASALAWWTLWALLGPAPVVLAAVGVVAVGTGLAALESVRSPSGHRPGMAPR